jgi:SAM-dependent methyltransferase
VSAPPHLPPVSDPLRRPPSPDLAASVAAAYGAGAGAWAVGPARAYDHLAEVLVAASPLPVAGALVLDLGAGTGAVSRVVAAAGGRPVAVDLAAAMLLHDRRRRPPAAVGDACALPFRTGAFDAVAGAFCLNHVPDPDRALSEAARVTRPGGAVLASVFSARSGHPAKDQVEGVAARFGFRRPDWYERLKADVEPLTAEPGALAAAARAAGLSAVDVVERPVELGLQAPADLVAWRLGTPSLAGFAASLPPARRAALVAAAEEALGPAPQPFTPLILILSSRVAA